MANFITKSLMNKLIVLFLAVSIIPIAIVGYMSYASGRAAIQNTFTDSFTALSEGKEAAILEYLESGLEIVGATARNRFIQESVEKIDRTAVDKDKIAGEIESELTEIKEIDKHINEIFILNPEGRIIASSEKGAIGQDKSKDTYFLGGKEGPFIKDAYFSESAKKNVFAFAAPIKKGGTQEFLGVLVTRMDLGHLNELTTSNVEGMGKTGETYIVNKDGYMLSESRFIKDTTLKQRVDTEPVKLFYNKKEIMTGVYRDYRGELVVGASMGDDISKAFPFLGWMILAEIDASEAFRPARALAMKTTLFSLLMAVLIAFVAFLAAQAIAKPIRRLSEQAVKIGEGDLTVNVADTKAEDEIGVLSKSFKQTIISLRAIVSQVLETAERVSSSSQQLSSSAQEMNATTEEVSSTVQQIAKGSETTAQRVEEASKVMEQMNASVSQVANSAQQTASASNQAAQIARKGSEAAKEAAQKMSRIYETVTTSGAMMKKLGERSEQINEITDVITNIADQTNLLALNAAIEAARAGEQGRGFAVVAEEVRKLAEGSAKAADQIAKLIKDVQKETNQAIGAMDTGSKEVTEGREVVTKAAQALVEIVQVVENTASMVEQISASTEEMSAGTKQVVKSVDDIASTAEEAASATEEASASTEEMTASMEEMAASAQELAGMAINLRELVGKFKVGDTPETRVQRPEHGEQKPVIVKHALAERLQANRRKIEALRKRPETGVHAAPKISDVKQKPEEHKEPEPKKEDEGKA